MRHWFLIGGLLTASAGHATVHVRSISLTPTAHGYHLSVDASAKARYSLHTYPEPARLIVDIPDAILDPAAAVSPVETGPLPYLRFSQFTRKPDAVRVVVHLPAGAQTWSEVSDSPSASISVDIPCPAAHGEPKAASASHGKPRSVMTAHANTDVSLLSRKDEKPSVRHPKHPVAQADKPKANEEQTSHADRTRLSSRKGAVDATDLMVDPAAAPAPAWDPDDAISLIKSSDCPDALRKRLIEVVSDPAIQTSRYVWGAETPGQFDCSGLVLYIYDALGVKLPRCSWQQCDVGESVERDALRAGDLVFFNTKGTGVSHVGIYLGDGRFLHAANPKSNLKITSLDTPYYSTRFVNARRVYGISDSSTLGG